MPTMQDFNLRKAINLGLIAGFISLFISVIGLTALLSKRQLIAGILTLGQLLIFLATALLSYQAAEKSSKKSTAIFNSVIVGLVAAIPLAFLIVFESLFDLRQFFVNVSPDLIKIISFGQGTTTGIAILFAAMGLVGLIMSLVYLLPPQIRRSIITGLVATLIIGTFSELLTERLRVFFGVAFSKTIFQSKALLPSVAAIILIVVTALSFVWTKTGDGIKQRFDVIPDRQKRYLRVGTWVVLLIILFLLPQILGSYLSEVINNVGIFVLMGLGLNIVVGFAGLLDLGYVAFFAIGAYTMAVLTSTGALGVGHVSFWLALPVSVTAATLAGIMLGTPVLRMRGDYLAIVTLGFGEIIRILANSDMLKSFLGGAQGILNIPKPEFMGTALIQPAQLYYVVLAGCLLAAFVSYRLSRSRLGRQWMAIREDEDVAKAMGINLVKTKLLAFAIGAAFSGLAGAIFASKLTSIFPHSFNLLISINVLCLIIVGGMGSLPGVVVGALILVGLPELLREFAEYRYLMYGALLIVMMLAKPEGFWPSAIQRRELHAFKDTEPVPDSTHTE
ncbi:MAG: branched-chain amino acid ABC transporter permease [Anaerolineales bacterium]